MTGPQVRPTLRTVGDVMLAADGPLSPGEVAARVAEVSRGAVLISAEAALDALVVCSTLGAARRGGWRGWVAGPGWTMTPTAELEAQWADAYAARREAASFDAYGRRWRR